MVGLRRPSAEGYSARVQRAVPLRGQPRDDRGARGGHGSPRPGNPAGERHPPCRSRAGRRRPDGCAAPRRHRGTPDPDEPARSSSARSESGSAGHPSASSTRCPPQRDALAKRTGKAAVDAAANRARTT